MKKLTFVIFACFIFVCCGNRETKGRTASQNATIDSLRAVITKPDADYIYLSLTQLYYLLRADETSFLTEMGKLGFSTEENRLFAKQSVFDDNDSMPFGAGVMFHNLPALSVVITKDEGYEWINYTFPIQYLSYYKIAILESDAKFEKQSVEYSNHFDIHYIEETYINRFQKVEYTLKYSKSYGCIDIRERNY